MYNNFILKLSTLTPLWTGDAWGENVELKPQSIIGALRFWFEVYCKTTGIIKDWSGKERLKLKQFEDDVKSFIEQGMDIEEAKIKALDNQHISLVSQIFGCNGWKGSLKVKSIKKKEDNIKKANIDFKYLIDTRWWCNTTLFNGKDDLMFFKDVEVEFSCKSCYIEDMKRFLKYYEDKIILMGGKKSFGFGFVKLSSDLDLHDILLPLFGSIYGVEKVKVENRNANYRVVLGFNFKYYQRKKEYKKYRSINFGNKDRGSNFYFSNTIGDYIYILGFSDSYPPDIFRQLLNKYTNFDEEGVE